MLHIVFFEVMLLEDLSLMCTELSEAQSLLIRHCIIRLSSKCMRGSNSGLVPNLLRNEIFFAPCTHQMSSHDVSPKTFLNVREENLGLAKGKFNCQVLLMPDQPKEGGMQKEQILGQCWLSLFRDLMSCFLTEVLAKFQFF